MSATKQVDLSHPRDHISSSPDPLNEPLTDQRRFISPSPSKRRSSHTANSTQRRASTQSSKAPLSSSRRSNPNTNSPSKTVTEQTLSPWKIRVTVEAEPEGTEGTERLQTYTQTTTIPLRGDTSPLQSIETPNPSRGRSSLSKPRSRASSTSRTRQRSGTPKPGRRRKQSITDLDLVVLGDDNDEDEWKKSTRKSQTRKSSVRARRNSTKTGEKSKGISSLVDDFNINEDLSTDQRGDMHEELHSESPELRQIDLNLVSVRQRSNSTKQKARDVPPGADVLPSKEFDVATGHEQSETARKFSANSTRSYPTPSPTPSEPDHVVPSILNDVHVEEYDTVMESEGFTMIDLDSIPSVRQLRSSPIPEVEATTEQVAATESRQSQSINDSSPQKVALPTPGKAFPSYLHLGADESEISSALPSSPPLHTLQSKIGQAQDLNRLQIPSLSSQYRDRKVTPQTYSSPSLPSPPRPAPPPKRNNPDSSQAMEAGMRLQGAMDSRQKEHEAHSQVEQPLTTPRLRSQPQKGTETGVFEGFDSGTQRELRAGLRFGEELARKPVLKTDSTKATISSVVHEQPRVWRMQQEQNQQYVQSHRNSTPPEGQEHAPNFAKGTRRSSLLSQSMNVSDLTPMSITETPTRPILERDGVVVHLQHEPTDAARQAQEMGTNTAAFAGDQVMPGNRSVDIHDVTMEDADEDDIWLAEAKDSSSSPREASGYGKLGRTSQPYQHDKVDEPFERARRNQIPHSWRRGDHVNHEVNNSTILSNADGESSISGVLWRAPSGRDDDFKFGAGQIRETRRELRQSGVSAFNDRSNSGAFDVSKMLATPKRIRESLEKKGNEVAGAEPESSPTANEETFEEDDTSAHIDESSFANLPHTVPVNFNESTLSDPMSSPYKTRRSLSPSAQRPPTPRSALKGSRHSLGPFTLTSSTENLDGVARRVIWAKRSNHMDEEWIESSRSMISINSTDHSETDIPSQDSPATTAETSEQEQHQHETTPEMTNSAATSEPKSWFGWLRNENQSNKGDCKPLEDLSRSLSELDTHDESAQMLHEESARWKPTSKSTVSSEAITQQDTIRSGRSGRSSKNRSKQNKIPSYLQPPSYPSDPKRSTDEPLSTSGDFTNAHFRTLHVIYAKSSRPRFHAPYIEECRPEIRKLVTEKWSMNVDEEPAGLGGFTFKFGDDMGRSLERFCREIEWGYLSASTESGELTYLDLLREGGIWGGAGHGNSEVQWGWTCDMLAQWLGRIVVGEVVRREEFGGKDYGKS